MIRQMDCRIFLWDLIILYLMMYLNKIIKNKISIKVLKVIKVIINK